GLLITALHLILRESLQRKTSRHSSHETIPSNASVAIQDTNTMRSRQNQVQKSRGTVARQMQLSGIRAFMSNFPENFQKLILYKPISSQ
ncbi:MAG: hypothetical protein LBB19_02340, partial [Puniceicoccales bacterium]|nr:hypothetical protein [Puniceicoccales bacterium]